MQCIYDKTIPCEINPDGPMTKNFECLECNKPKKTFGDKKNENIERKERNGIRHKIPVMRGKKSKEFNTPSQKMRRGRGNRRRGNRKRT